MPAGFESINNDGVYQINDTNPNYVLTHKGVYNTNVQSNNGSNTWYVQLNIADTAVVAFSSSTPTTFIKAKGNKVFFYQHENTRSPITVYQFERQPPSASVSGFGLQVWNGAGTLQYDSNYGPLQIIADIEGQGTFNVAPGRNIAVIPMYQPKETTDKLEGIQPVLIRVIIQTCGAVAISGGQFTTSMQAMYSWAKSWSQSGGPNFPSVASSDTRTRYAVVDVTHL